MDSSFTEHILERARERQKKLQELSSTGQFTPLRETNKILDKVRKTSSTCNQQNVGEFKKPFSKEMRSDSQLNARASPNDQPLKENCTQGSEQATARQNSATKRSDSSVKATPNEPGLKENSSQENVRVEVEIQESDDTDDEGGSNNVSKTVHSMETPGLREQAKSRLQKLGKLYAGGEDADISSPIQRTEAKFLSELETSPNDQVPATPTERSGKWKQRKGLSKLADLAQNISRWEDDVSNLKKDPTDVKKDDAVCTPKKSWKPPAPQPPTNSSSVNSPSRNTRTKALAPQPPGVNADSATKPKIVSSAQKLTPACTGKTDSQIGAEKPTPKQLKWDQAVLDTLESQGFSRTASNSRLVYNYNASQDATKAKPEPKQSTQTAEANASESGRSKLPENKISVHHLEITDISEEPEPEQEAKDIVTAKKFVPLNLVLEEEKVTPRSPTKTGARSAGIANKAALFESSPTRTIKDPAAMSIAEKKALFERNKGTALLPKAAFGMAAPVKETSAVKNLSAPKLNTEKSGQITSKIVRITPTSNIKPSDGRKASDVKTTPTKSTAKKFVAAKPKEDHIGSPMKAAFVEAAGIAGKIAALCQSKNTISQQQIQDNVREERRKEMELLMNRFTKNKDIGSDLLECSDESDGEDTTETTAMIAEKPAKVVTKADVATPPPPPPSQQSSRETRRSGEKRTKDSDSPRVAAVLEDVKRIKVTQPKEGKLYPCLSDIETATETEPEPAVTPSPNTSYGESFCSSEGGANTSFGREILQAVCKNQTPQKRPILDESTASDVSDILDDMDDYLDEAMADELSNCSNGPTPPKVGKITPPSDNLPQPSESFNYKSFSSKANQQKSPSHLRSPMKTVTSPKRSGDLPAYVVDGEDLLPLTHTVKTPVRQISRHAILEESADDNRQSDENEIVSRKIQDLLDEVNKQQMVISQTSQALNLCNATPEFMGSTEQVEAEKVLLLATHRRQACLHEVQRLRVEGALRPRGQHAQNIPVEKGALTISNITLPLKREYVRALAAAGGKGHHVVCLVKSGEQVLPTHLVSTVASSSKNPDQELHVPGTVRLEKIFSDFTVTFEVYCLQAQEEVLPHEVKYHINKKASSKLTPKKAKQESRMIRPPKESPAGPQAVRTSTFALMGYAVFSIQAVNKTHWTLSKAPPMSPLEGSVEMKISCELAVSLEHKGFLTMFEDVSGFGAWHRRWCLLNGDTLSYWKYPDDEKKKAPIDSISLRNSVTDVVGPVSRDICARPHTFLIDRERDAQTQDKDSLTVVCKGTKTVIRHLLSADTKEERIEWCNMFNKALLALKMWGNN